MKSKVIAEAIILQSLEDLYDARHREASVAFFSGQEFRVCAKAAGMVIDEKIKLLNIVKKITRLPLDIPALSEKQNVKKFKYGPTSKTLKTNYAVNA